MGRRDGGGKRKTWMIEAGDWEKLYEALLKAKEKNNMLEVRLQRKTDLIEMQRRHRDKALFNDIFEQRKLVFKYQNQGDSPRATKGQGQEGKVKDRYIKKMPKTEREITAETKAKTAVVTNLNTPRWKLERKLTLPNLGGGGTRKPQALELESHRPSEKLMQLTLPTVTQTTGLSLTARPAERTKHRPSVAGIQESLPLTNAHLQRYSTMPNLHIVGDTYATQAAQEKEENDTAAEELWVGEPEAIGSVRRPRLKPEEMSTSTQPKGEARKLLIELSTPNTCSRNCAGTVRAGLGSLGGKDNLVAPAARSVLELTQELTTEEILGNMELLKLYTNQALSSRI